MLDIWTQPTVTNIICSKTRPQNGSNTNGVHFLQLAKYFFSNFVWSFGGNLSDTVRNIDKTECSLKRPD